MEASGKAEDEAIRSEDVSGGEVSVAERKDVHQPTAFRALVAKSLTSTKPAKSSALTSLSFFFHRNKNLIIQKYGF